MIVTDKNIEINDLLLARLRLMAVRVVKHKFDNLIIIDGDEGYGKSNLASAICYYFAWKTKRKFSVDNVFFKIEDMMEFAKSTEKQVIWWDEAALGGLTSQGFNQMQIQLLQLLMTGRKKQHFYIFVIPKYFRLKQNIIDRAMCLVHVYSRDQITRGRFGYYNKYSLEKMYDYWKKTRDKGYKKFINFHGEFKETLPLLIDETKYEKKKDEAIMSIGNDERETKKVKKLEEQIVELRYLLVTMPTVKSAVIANHIGINPRTLFRWKKKVPLSSGKGSRGVNDEQGNDGVVDDVDIPKLNSN
jgi:hypothetical protein